MQKIIILIALHAVATAALAAQNAPAPAAPPPAAPAPGLLAGAATAEQLRDRLIPRDQWTPFPRAGDRAAWEKADRRLLDGYIKHAEQNIGFKWPALPATLSLELVRTGNRTHYERVSFQRRATLAALLVAELAEDKGRFMDQIINGIWTICEESWWGVSAHIRERDGLMDVGDPFVDLFAATTSELLAWTDYFLGEKLDAVSPKIRARIHAEITRRILQPVMLPKKHRKHGWMTGTNNWNPWICSNWLASALLVEKDEAARAAHVAKILETLDYFLTPYPQDGGCDEGPGYWGVACGSLYDSLVLLNSATNDAFADLYKNEKIQNMLKYIARVQISDKTKHAINFADAGPRISSDGTLVWRFGRDIGDAGMAGFGRATVHWRGPRRAHYARIFHDLFSRAEMEATPPGAPLYGEVWLPDLQVAAARETEGSDAGFYFAAKGGHNSESHNHND
ncbi:MAG: hypothetical protein LBI02_12190, partial [Opitutaceae bacterium]|nr:hypothetical protein [Opitutaceae bacterium]